MTHWAPSLGSVTGRVADPPFQAPARPSALDAGDEHVHRGGHFDLLKEHAVWGRPGLVGCPQQALGVLQEILVPTAAESAQRQNGQDVVSPVET